MVLLKNFGNIFKIPELTKKILFTLGVLIIYRIGSVLPVIGIDTQLLAQYMKNASGFSGFLGYFNTMTGGALDQCTLFALGVGPYITSSIFMQVLSMAVPSLEALSKDDYGRKQINQYTRYLTLFFAIAYSFGYAVKLESINVTTPILLSSGIGFKLLFTLSMAVGAIFTMWLGEQISIFGIGSSGSSVIIFSSIVARFPKYISSIAESLLDGQMHWIIAIIILLGFVLISMCIIFLEKGQRKIPVQYARRVVGTKVYGGQSSYLPFKINAVGIMPVIFAQTALNMPILALNFITSYFPSMQVAVQSLSVGGFLYSSLEFALIVVFNFLFSSVYFNPVEIADSIKKSGGFVPGIRPGKSTATYFNYILVRIGLVGAIYLGILAITPNVIGSFLQLPFLLSGTSLLILVGVALDLSAQIESYLIESNYEGFLSSGRMRKRLG